MTKTYKIAIIPGDGIGTEVMPEAVRVLDAATKRFGISIDYKHIEWASCEYYLQHGRMRPDDGKRNCKTATPSSSARSAGPTPSPITSRCGARSSSSAVNST